MQITRWDNWNFLHQSFLVTERRIIFMKIVWKKKLQWTIYFCCFKHSTHIARLDPQLWAWDDKNWDKNVLYQCIIGVFNLTSSYSRINQIRLFLSNIHTRKKQNYSPKHSCILSEEYITSASRSTKIESQCITSPYLLMHSKKWYGVKWGTGRPWLILRNFRK